MTAIHGVKQFNAYLGQRRLLHYRTIFQATLSISLQNECAPKTRRKSFPQKFQQQQQSPITTWGKVSLGVGGVLLAANAVFLTSAIPAVLGRGAPYLPTFQKSIRFVLDEALPAIFSQQKQDKFDSNQPTSNDRSSTTIVDLGSGDGRVIIDAARRGYHATGYEINPFLVLFSRLWAWYDQHMAPALFPGKYSKWHEHGSAFFYWMDIWKIKDLHDAHVIFVYGLGPIMDQLSEKLVREARGNVIVVSNVFQIKSSKWERVYWNEEVNVHLYQRTPEQQREGKERE